MQLGYASFFIRCKTVALWCSVLVFVRKTMKLQFFSYVFLKVAGQNQMELSDFNVIDNHANRRILDFIP
jgi:hypothetical protein